MKQAWEPAEKIALVVLILLVTSLAALSKYSFQASTEVNFEIALMLTPVGIFKNLIWFPDAPLAPYYHQAVSRQGLFQNASVVALVVGILFVCAFLLTRLKRLK